MFRIQVYIKLHLDPDPGRGGDNKMYRYIKNVFLIWLTYSLVFSSGTGTAVLRIQIRKKLNLLSVWPGWCLDPNNILS